MTSFFFKTRDEARSKLAEVTLPRHRIHGTDFTTHDGPRWAIYYHGPQTTDPEIFDGAEGNWEVRNLDELPLCSHCHERHNPLGVCEAQDDGDRP